MGTQSDEERQARIAKLEQELAALKGSQTAEQTGSGAIAQGPDAVAAGAQSAAIGGSVTGNVEVNSPKTYVSGDMIVVGEVPVRMDAVARESALGRYLEHLISRNRYLQLQGIRSGGKLVNIELDRIYVRLRGVQQRTVEREAEWLAREAALAPGEARRPSADRPDVVTEIVTISVEEALGAKQRLVVLGDPGSGKTTLVRYLALLYARDMAEKDTHLVQDKLVPTEPARLPILLPLRQIGTFLRAAADDGTEGHARLLDFLLRSLHNERITLPDDFFDAWLTTGDAVILLDGLDEVADPDLRRRVARLVESFTRAYPTCRYVVTSRIVGYTGAARLGEDYATTTIQDFTLADVEQFLSAWHQLVAAGQLGPGEDAHDYAAAQTRQLLQAIQANERIRELAINPLMLTVIAMVHRDRVKLPDRRAELYAEAVDVLLGKWEEAKGIQELPVLPDIESFDTGDKRLMLQNVALRMHEQKTKDIAVDELRKLLNNMFWEIVHDDRRAGQAADRFLHMIEERTGLLIARGVGSYAFSHLTFQEYLTALAVADRADYITYTLKRAANPWWREVVLLEAGFLSTQGKDRATRLIKAIADRLTEPEPYHNLVLAAECLRDVGSGRIGGNLEQEVQRRLRKGIEEPRPLLSRMARGIGTKGWIERRSTAMDAIVRAGGGFWTMPFGEPEWVTVPAGEFWMGSEVGFDFERPQHRLHLDEFQIARTPITNAQYFIFVQAAECAAPSHWQDGRPVKGYESHPVVNVTWDDALAYCRWLRDVTGKPVTLPSEAQWEKAARGGKDKREYPWSDQFDAAKCNCGSLGIGDTTPVGIFPEGASPYGCLDIAGNVWEWTLSLWGADSDRPEFGYPYDANDGRERLNADASVFRVLRGGSFYYIDPSVRCAYRFRNGTSGRYGGIGFRVVLSPSPLVDDHSGR